MTHRRRPEGWEHQGWERRPLEKVLGGSVNEPVHPRRVGTCSFIAENERSPLEGGRLSRVRVSCPCQVPLRLVEDSEAPPFCSHPREPHLGEASSCWHRHGHHAPLLCGPVSPGSRYVLRNNLHSWIFPVIIPIMLVILSPNSVPLHRAHRCWSHPDP